MAVIRGIPPVAVDASGYGDDSGRGYCYGGDGDGSGSGSYGDDGRGRGSGSGYCYGGDGDGGGSSYCYGGDGDGRGSGSYGDDGDDGGSGSYGDDGRGRGSGRGDGYWVAVFQSLNVREDSQAFFAFWKSDLQGFPANGGKSARPATPGLIEEDAGPLEICENGLHGTLCPPRWKGDRLWLVALYGEIQRHDDKIAALKREIICEVV